MKKIFFNGTRLLFGLILVTFGLNGFFLFIQPPSAAPAGQAFLDALFATGYMLPFWKSIEILSGLMFLANRFVALGAVLMAPISLNILAYHFFLDTSNTVLGLVVVALNAIVAVSVFDRYRPILRA